jgi:zinc D-Ala-D-Ala carboxypeptidase
MRGGTADREPLATLHARRVLHLPDCTSQTAARMGRLIEATPADIQNLARLCVLVLEPLRDALDRPIVITSGLRPEWLNAEIRGSKTSAHVTGRAADIKVPGMTPLEVCQMVRTLMLPVDQCIHEFPPQGWTHIGIAAEGTQRRNQFLTARVVNGKTIYESGVNA